MATALNVSAWSTTAASNDGADSTIGTVANTSSPTVVDDWTRAIMASVKKYVLDTDGGLTSSGTDTITITTNRNISAGHQAAGFSLRFKAGGTNSGAATLDVDSLGAVAIKRQNGDALSAGDIVSGGIYDVAFDGTNYKLLGANAGATGFGSLTGANTWSGANVFQSSVTVGDGSGDVVVIKGTTVNSLVSAAMGSATPAAFYTAIGTVPLANGGSGQTPGPAAFKAFADSLTELDTGIAPASDELVYKDATDGEYKRIDMTDLLLDLSFNLSQATMASGDVVLGYDTSTSSFRGLMVP